MAESPFVLTANGGTLRLIFHLEKNAEDCGGQGDAYVGDVEMNKPQRTVNAKGDVDLKDRWIKLDKHYSILVDELHDPTPGLLDADNCLE